jgi:predicted RNA polymerase sigma factor
VSATIQPGMSKRLSRAKRKIKEPGIPFAVPPAHVIPASLKSGAERGEVAAYPAGEMSRWS